MFLEIFELLEPNEELSILSPRGLDFQIVLYNHDIGLKTMKEFSISELENFKKAKKKKRTQ